MRSHGGAFKVSKVALAGSMGYTFYLKGVWLDDLIVGVQLKV